MSILFCAIKSSNEIITSSNKKEYLELFDNVNRYIDLDVDGIKSLCYVKYRIHISIKNKIAYICYTTLTFSISSSYIFLEKLEKSYPNINMKNIMINMINGTDKFEYNEYYDVEKQEDIVITNNYIRCYVLSVLSVAAGVIITGISIYELTK